MSAPTRPLTLAVGEVLMDRYQVIRFVARGGMGEVYEARDSILNETVAIKTLAWTAVDRPAAMSRFLAEVRTARQVTHPNICRILEFGFHRPAGSPPGSGEQVPFLTMEFLNGETLARRIAREGRLAPATVATLLPQIVAGMAAIHAAGIVHRDIKPQNIVILPGPPERVVVTDFGLARMLDPGSLASSETGPFLVGTVDYMSPEQIEGKTPTRGFDIYALGVVIFEMLTGRKPFVGSTALATVLERLKRPAPPPSHFLPGLERGWDDLVARCLTLNPDRRFSRVEEVVPPPAQARRGSGSRRRLLGLTIAGTAAVAAVLAVIVVRGWRPEEAPARTAFPPESLVAAELATRPPGAPPARALRRLIAPSGCSEDMVAVAGRFCIDRFEASTVDDVEERPLSPHHPPWAPLAQAVQQRWQKRLQEGKAGSNSELSRLEPFQTEDRWRPRAVSARLAIPQGYINRPLAAAACANAGKRLCTEEEWRTACRGEDDTRFPYGSEYQQGACNIFREAHPALVLYGVISGPLDDPRLNRVGWQGRMLLQKTGDFEACKSRWGSDAVYDMVGNLDEWVQSSEVVYLGGFYARDSRDGCEYRNDHHQREGGTYFNFSTGFRCCDSLHVESAPTQDRP